MAFSMERRRFLAQTGQTVLAAGIGGALLEACGGGSSSSGTSSGPATLTYGWWSNTPAKDNSMKAWLQDFTKSSPNIKINPEIIQWGNYWDKLKTTTAGGKAYDIIGVSSGMAAPYYDEGALVDLSTFPDFQDVIKGLNPASVSICQWNGKTYGLPVGTSVSVMGYNKALLDAAGVPAPDPVKPMTYDEFIAMGKKISKNGVYAINPVDILDFDTFVRMAGGQSYDQQINPTKVTINTPEGIQGLTDYQRLFTEGLSPAYNMLNNGSGPYAYDFGALETNKIAFARVGAWLFSDMQKNPNYGITPLFYTKKPVVLGGVNSFSIYKGSKNQEAAWEFIKWSVTTQPEISFAKFSDIPANQDAFSQLDTYVQPANFAPTLKAAFPTFQPLVMTTKDTLTSTLNDIITDLMNNKLTPAQAAAKMEQQGNAVLASS